MRPQRSDVCVARACRVAASPRALRVVVMYSIRAASNNTGV